MNAGTIVLTNGPFFEILNAYVVQYRTAGMEHLAVIRTVPRSALYALPDLCHGALFFDA